MEYDKETLLWIKEHAELAEGENFYAIIKEASLTSLNYYGNDSLRSEVFDFLYNTFPDDTQLKTIADLRDGNIKVPVDEIKKYISKDNWDELQRWAPKDICTAKEAIMLLDEGSQFWKTPSGFDLEWQDAEIIVQRILGLDIHTILMFDYIFVIPKEAGEDTLEDVEEYDLSRYKDPNLFN